MLRRLPLVLYAVAGVALVSGCGDNTTGPKGPGTVMILFDDVVDGQPLQMNNRIYTNAAGNLYQVSTLEYVVSAIHLHDASGAETDLGDIHYRSEADANTRTATYTDVPAGSYATLSFTMGIHGADNVSGAYPALDQIGMAWPAMMGGGYHYMRAEGTFDTTGPADGYFTHTGPSGGNDYSVDYDLDDSIDVQSGKTTVIVVQMDLNEWYKTPNLYDFNDYTSGIMGNQAVQALLQQNGVDAFSILQVTVE